MPTDPFKEVKDAWDWFLIQSVVARNYDGLYFQNRMPSNPMVDRSIVSLLTVALASVLDEALGIYASHFGLPVKKDRLCDRIETLRLAGKVSNADKLHDVRKARNECAHGAGHPEDMQKAPDWAKLDAHIKEVATALRDLGMLGLPKKYEYFAERTPVEPPQEGAVVSLRYRSGVKRDGIVALAHEFTMNHYGLGQGPPKT